MSSQALSILMAGTKAVATDSAVHAILAVSALRWIIVAALTATVTSGSSNSSQLQRGAQVHKRAMEGGALGQWALLAADKLVGAGHWANRPCPHDCLVF